MSTPGPTAGDPQGSVERVQDYLANCANPDGTEDGPPRVCMCFEHPIYDDDLRALLARLATIAQAAEGAA